MTDPRTLLPHESDEDFELMIEELAQLVREGRVPKHLQGMLDQMRELIDSPDWAEAVRVERAAVRNGRLHNLSNVRQLDNGTWVALVPAAPDEGLKLINTEHVAWTADGHQPWNPEPPRIAPMFEHVAQRCVHERKAGLVWSLNRHGCPDGLHPGFVVMPTANGFEIRALAALCDAGCPSGVTMIDLDLGRELIHAEGEDSVWDSIPVVGDLHEFEFPWSKSAFKRFHRALCRETHSAAD